MKSTSILSLITAGALVVTVGSSFAAWDQTKDEAIQTLDIATRTVVEFNSDSLTWTGPVSFGEGANKKPTLGTATSYGGGMLTSAFQIDITQVRNVKSLTLTADTFAVEGITGDDQTKLNEMINVAFTDTDHTSAPIANGGVDDTLVAEQTGKSANHYGVTVVLKDAPVPVDSANPTTEETAAAAAYERVAALIAGKPLTFTIHADATGVDRA